MMNRVDLSLPYSWSVDELEDDAEMPEVWTKICPLA